MRLGIEGLRELDEWLRVAGKDTVREFEPEDGRLDAAHEVVRFDNPNARDDRFALFGGQRPDDLPARHRNCDGLRAAFPREAVGAYVRGCNRLALCDGHGGLAKGRRCTDH